MLKSKKQKKLQTKIQKSFLQKYLIGTGVIGTIILVWFILYFQPIQSKISDYSSDINEWMEKIKMASVSKNAIDLLEINVDSLKIDIANIEKRIFYLDEIQYIAKELIKYSSSYHLNMQSITPSYDVLFPVDQLERETGPLVKLPIEMKMEGRYINTGKFLADVDKLPFIFSPDEVFFDADAKIYPKLIIIVRGYLFLLNEDKPSIKEAQSL